MKKKELDDLESIKASIATLANLSQTLVECIEILVRASDDPEAKIEVISKLGAFAVSEQRSA